VADSPNSLGEASGPLPVARASSLPPLAIGGNGGPGRQDACATGRAWPGALALTAVYLLISIWSLHLKPIENPDEPRYTCAARDIVEGQGDWRVPSFNNEPRLKKPPLIYWALASSGFAGRAAGLELVTAFRLAPLLAGLLTILAVYGLGRRLSGPRTGLLAALLLMTTTYFTGQCLEIDTDLLLTAGLVSAWYCFIAALQRLRAQPGRTPALPLLGLYGCLGLACLTKGPFLTGVFFVLPAAVYLLWDRAACPLALNSFKNWLLRTGLLWGAPLVLALGLGWNLLLFGAGLGAEGESAMVHENLARFLGGVDHNKGLQMYPWFFYLQNLPGQGLPWSLLWIPMLILAWRELGASAWRLPAAAGVLLVTALALAIVGGPHPETLWRFDLFLILAVLMITWTAAVCWWWARGEQPLTGDTKLLVCAVGLPFLLMGLAGSKRASYLLPVIPFLALWAGLLWTRWEEPAEAEGRSLWTRLWPVLLGLVAAVAGLAALAVPILPWLTFRGSWSLTSAEIALSVGLALLVLGGAGWGIHELARGRRGAAGLSILLAAAAALADYHAVVFPAKYRAEGKPAFYAELEQALAGRPLVWLGGTANEAVWYLRCPVKRLVSYAALKDAFFAVPGACLLVRGREWESEPLLRAAVRELHTLRQGDRVFHLVVRDPDRPPAPELFGAVREGRSGAHGGDE